MFLQNTYEYANYLGFHLLFVNTFVKNVFRKLTLTCVKMC